MHVMKRTSILLGGTLVACVLALLIPTRGQAQFYQFSQYYHAGALLNPALIGSSGHRYKVNTLVRWQWMGIAENTNTMYKTSAVSGQWIFGHPLSENRYVNHDDVQKNAFLSLGVSFVQNNQANGTFMSRSVLFSPAVMVRLANQVYMSAGIEYNINRYTLGNYIMVEDYLNGSNVTSPTIIENNSDVSTGLLFIINNSWVGVSLKDMITTPYGNGAQLINENKTFYDNVYVHGGTSFPLRVERDLFFTSSFSFKKRVQYKQVEAGMGIIRSFTSGYSWSATVGYRGVGRNPQGLSNVDAAIFTTGFNIPTGVVHNFLTHKKADKFPDFGVLGIHISSDFIHSQFSQPLRTWEVGLVWNAPSHKGSGTAVRPLCEDMAHGPLGDQITKNLYGGIHSYRSDAAPKKKDWGKEKSEKLKRKNVKKVNKRKQLRTY